MNTLKIPIVSIGETGYALDARAPISELQPPETSTLPVQEVSVTGQFTALGSGFLFRGVIAADFTEACYRCLEPAQESVTVEVTWVFEEGASNVFQELNHASDDDVEFVSDSSRSEDAPRSFQGPEIDLAPYVWEELVFAQPSRFLCSEACNGLCPHCGVNLNENVCACADVAIEKPTGHSGFAALAQLFPELAPDTKKE